jgi:serine/threonine-protein kinase
VRIVRQTQTDPKGGLSDSADVVFLANWIASRGHLREAGRLLGNELARERPDVYLGIALLGAVPAESAAVTFESWRRSEEPSLVCLALPWWTSRGDTVTLHRVARRAESGARLGREEREREAWSYLVAAAPAYLALARRDTIDALRSFLALPESLGLDCDFDPLETALLLSAAGRDREAYARLVPVFPRSTYAPRAIEGLWVLERARVAERLDERETAAEDYRWVAGIWRNADPELQPYVAEARAGLKRITGEPRR